MEAVMRRLLLAVLPFAISLLIAESPLAKTPNEILSDNRAAVVHIEVAAAPDAPNRIPFQGTGFIINAAGIVLTARHNLNGFNFDNPTTTPIMVRIGSLSAPKVLADVFDRNFPRDVDVVLLKIRGAPPIRYQVAERGDSATLIPGARLYVVGFNSGSDMSIESAMLATDVGKGTNGPNYMDLTAPGVRFGMSGAPVFDEDGTVVGLIAGGLPSTTTALAHPAKLLEAYPPILNAWNNEKCVVRAQPIYFSLYVVDVTQGMLAPDRSGKSKLEAVEQELETTAKKVMPDCFGGVAFGGTFAPGTPPRDDCARIADFYPLGRFDPTTLDEAIKQLQPRGKRIPLVDAIARALRAYQPFRTAAGNRPKDRFTFAIITSGPDSCGKESTDDFIDVLNRWLDAEQLKAVLYDNRLLPIMVQFASGDDVGSGSRIGTPQYTNPDQPLAILLVSDNEKLKKAVRAIAEISSADIPTRRLGCTTLVGMFREQGDEAGAQKVNRRCES
jgi:hypothetical protein